MTNPMSDSEILDWLEKRRATVEYTLSCCVVRFYESHGRTPGRVNVYGDNLRAAVQLAAGRP